MFKILILANDNATIYYFRRELLAKLINEKYEVIISVPRSDKNIEFENLGCQIDEIVLNKTGTNPLQDYALYWSYLKQMKRLKPDLVLTYTAKPNIYGSLACQKLKIPYINNVTGLGSMFQSDNLIRKIMLLLQKKAYRVSRCVFFQNAANKKYFEDKNIVGTNTALLPGSGVNLAKYEYETYPEDYGPVRFAIVSRIRKDKGFDEFFEAMKIVNETNGKAEFYLAGIYEDETYKKQTLEMSKAYPLTFLGMLSQEELQRLLSRCHCLIHPSHHEGMANSILEAAAVGRPCIASDIPGCREAIDDGITGFLFKVKDSDSLAQAILKFLGLKQQQRAAMGYQGREKMEKEFDRSIVVNAYMKEIAKVSKEQ
jgi:glycosyltransferase involved in cell wall biosynthesis